MAMKRTFDTVNGQIIGETVAGGAFTRYLPDALGSVTMTAQNGVASAQSTYTPYGRGTPPTGATFGWVGGWGYFPTGLSFASHYVRARVVDNTAGRWTTVDPLWPSEPEFSYSRCNPTSWIDPSGLQWVP